MTGYMPHVTLKNGLKVANFSSPHPFTFEDGTVLEACSPERARALMLIAEEIEMEQEGWTDIALSFKLSPEVKGALMVASRLDYLDIVLVPLPVRKAIDEAVELDGFGAILRNDIFRTIRVKDRVTKEIYCDRFCV